MKNDVQPRSAAPALSPEAFQAFFEALEHPAALCDPQLTLLAVNPAFELLCGVSDAQGQNLGTLLSGVAKAIPSDGSTTEVEVGIGSGQSMTLTLSRRGETIAVLARNLSQTLTGGTLAAAGRALIEQARTEQALLELGRQVASATSEEQLVAVVARGVKGLFPGRTFCLRIVDGRTCALTSLYAEGRLRDGTRDLIAFRRSAALKTHLSTENLPPDRVRISDDEVPLLFHDSVRSICAPLVSSGQLFGVINVEYPGGLTGDLVTDERLLIQLANQVAVGVRNAKLIDELTFVRKYLEELLEHANALILVANRERQILVFNQKLVTLTGLSKTDVLGRDLLQFIPEAERLRVMRVLAASLRGEKVGNFETRMLGHGGQEVRVSFATSSVLSTSGGEVEGVIAIGQDLTMVRELEKRVIQAGKLSSLGQLAASVAHEINNPMTAVAAYAEAMLQNARVKPGTEADQEKLKKIIANSERILRFTRDLVSYSRPQDSPARVDLHAVLEQAVGFCDHELVRHGISVERRFGELPQIAAVKTNLIQVFVNLITNACHAMPPGGKVTLSTSVEGGDVVVRVQDSGTGIDPKHLSQIFEPFFTTKPDGKGTGLGLSIVQGIVERHGGEIRVESALGAGTAFFIRLPLPHA